MLSHVYYLIRSKLDGSYLVAHPEMERSQPSDQPLRYVLLFRAYEDALSYLNTHGSGVAQQFAVESVAGTQLASLLDRWGFTGIGMVQDPLLPRVEFLSR